VDERSFGACCERCFGERSWSLAVTWWCVAARDGLGWDWLGGRGCGE
jgi:hypothetical protein